MFRRLRLFAATIIVAGGLGSIQAADVEFVHVWPGWRPADSFMKISEYFTGREPAGDSIIERTHPAYRAGYYFVARIKHPKTAVAGAKFVLHIILPGSPLPKIFTFSANAPIGTNLFELGLTGVDWPLRSTRPVAWMLELVSADGHPDRRQGKLPLVQARQGPAADPASDPR